MSQDYPHYHVQTIPESFEGCTFVIFTGQYSDRTPVGVAESPEAAEDWCRRYAEASGKDWDSANWEAVPLTLPTIRRYYQFQVQLDTGDLIPAHGASISVRPFTQSLTELPTAKDLVHLLTLDQGCICEVWNPYSSRRPTEDEARADALRIRDHWWSVLGGQENIRGGIGDSVVFLNRPIVVDEEAALAADQNDAVDALLKRLAGDQKATK